MGGEARRARRARRTRCTRCSTTTATTSRRGARCCCGACSTRRGSRAAGGIEPPPARADALRRSKRERGPMSARRARAAVASVRVLSVTHGPRVPGGVFDEVVERRGHALERWVVPLGGRAAAPPRHELRRDHGLRRLHAPGPGRRLRLARAGGGVPRGALASGVPVLGVCLGAQMLARAAGAWVGPAPAPEIGWFEVELTPAGRDDSVLGALPARTQAFQWHHYTFAVPEGGTELARSEACTQAFRARAARLGDPVPRRGDAADAPGLDRRGRRRAAGEGRRRSSPRRRPASGAGTSRAARSATRSSRWRATARRAA